MAEDDTPPEDDTPEEEPSEEKPKPKKKYKAGWKLAYNKSSKEDHKIHSYALGLYAAGVEWQRIVEILKEKFGRSPEYATINRWAKECGLEGVRFNSIKALKTMSGENKEILTQMTSSLADAMRERTIEVGGKILDMVDTATRSVIIKSATEMSLAAGAASRLIDTGLGQTARGVPPKETKEIEAINVTPMSTVLMSVFQQAITDGVITTEGATKIMEMLESRMSQKSLDPAVIDVEPEKDPEEES